MSAIDALLKRRDEAQTELDALLEAPTAESRNLTTDEDAKFEELRAEIVALDDRVVELRDLAQRQEAAAEARKLSGDTGRPQGGGHVTDEPIYKRNDVSTSYFRDVHAARQMGDHEAADRLRRNDKQVADQLRSMSDTERRALGNTGAVGGSGGEFAPPLWLVADFVALARPGRKFADSLNPMPLPSGVASVNLPKVTGGTTTAIQTTQNTALSQTDMTTGAISSGIVTIGGKQVVSLQLLQQSGIPFDQVVLQDLAADYAKQFDVQVILGSNAAGQLNGVYTYFNASGTQNVTWTQATPAVGGPGGLYAKIFGAAANVETSRFLPPDTIWMHPRRWNWILAAADTQNRPLVNPSATSVNVVGQVAGVGAAQGVVGQIGALKVITDPNIPTNTGAGNNQDPILVGVQSDLRLWESALQTQTFDATYADSAGVLFRVLAYSAAIPHRYSTSVAVINGTGLVPPAF